MAKKPELAPDAKHWYRFWSIRLAVIAAVLSTVEIVMPLSAHWIPDHLFSVLSATVAMSAAVARVVRQQLPL